MPQAVIAIGYQDWPLHTSSAFSLVSRYKKPNWLASQTTGALSASINFSPALVSSVPLAATFLLDSVATLTLQLFSLPSTVLFRNALSTTTSFHLPLGFLPFHSARSPLTSLSGSAKVFFSSVPGAVLSHSTYAAPAGSSSVTFSVERSEFTRSTVTVSFCARPRSGTSMVAVVPPGTLSSKSTGPLLAATSTNWLVSSLLLISSRPSGGSALGSIATTHSYEPSTFKPLITKPEPQEVPSLARVGAPVKSA